MTRLPPSSSSPIAVPPATSTALPPDVARVALLEDLTLTAWPALKTIHHDGWLIRLSGGHTGRANSVNVIAPGHLPPAEKIPVAEAAYRAAGLDSLFRLTPLSPPGLDTALAVAGYAAESPSLVLLLDRLRPETGEDRGADGVTVTIDSTLGRDWIDAYCAITGVPDSRRAALAGILAAIAPTALYGAARVDGVIVATALTVIDRGHAGLFDVGTRADLRGRGLAGRVIGALLSRAATLGAGAAYLQVGAANTPALSLYTRLGFRVAYPYHYRHKVL
ncbi:MAG: hypothetical protein RLY86_390 [Pseudomonadota bacterium]|jgi:ribosomal protein S18 acetylase RimI-like enzyme